MADSTDAPLTDATQPGTAETGAGGASGTTSPGGTKGTPPPNQSDTSHVEVVVNPVIKKRTWHGTHQEAALQGGYTAIRTTLVHTLPGVRTQLQHLSRRPIGG